MLKYVIVNITKFLLTEVLHNIKLLAKQVPHRSRIGEFKWDGLSNLMQHRIKKIYYQMYTNYFSVY